MIESVSGWRELLRCPVCLGRLSSGAGEAGFACPGCGLDFPCPHNIPVMVPAAHRRRGVKESTELAAQLDEHLATYEDRATNEKVKGRIAGVLAAHGIAAGPRSRILEIGCGPFESLHDAPGEIKVGVDLLATSYLERLPFRRARSNVVEAFAEVLPFPDGSFDIAVSRNSLDHLNDPELALREIRRVLRDGGTCVLACYIDSDPFVTHEPFVLTQRFIDRFVTRLFSVVATHRRRREGGTGWDWIELVLAPRPGPAGHRPFGPDVFDAVAESYLELFARGYAAVARGDLESGIGFLRRSVAANGEYFWNAACLASAYFRCGRDREGRELAREICDNIRKGGYPDVESPRNALEKVLGPAAGAMSRWSRILNFFAGKPI